MENIEFSHVQLSLAREISVTQKNNILTDRIFLQISGRKQISAQPVINGTTVLCTLASGIDVGQGINVGPGKLGKKNKRRALNTHVLCSE